MLFITKSSIQYLQNHGSMPEIKVTVVIVLLEYNDMLAAHTEIPSIQVLIPTLICNSNLCTSGNNGQHWKL